MDPKRPSFNYNIFVGTENGLLKGKFRSRNELTVKNKH